MRFPWLAKGLLFRDFVKSFDKLGISGVSVSTACKGTDYCYAAVDTLRGSLQSPCLS